MSLPSAGKRRRLRPALQIAFGVVAVVSIVVVVVANFNALLVAIAKSDPWWLALAAVLVFAGMYATMLSWRAVVLSMGEHVGIVGAGQIYFTAQIGKYIPGAIWPVVASTQLAPKRGVRASVAVASMSVALMISVIVGCCFATGALLLIPALLEQYWALVLFVVLAGIGILVPPVLRRILGLAFRLVRRAGPLPHLRTADLLRAVLLAIVSWAFLGLHLWAIAMGQGLDDPQGLVLGVSGYAVAWLAGFFAFFTPAGAGVREVVLGLIFAGSLGGGAILALVVISRILMILVDVVLAATSLRFVRSEGRVTTVTVDGPRQ